MNLFDTIAASIKKAAPGASGMSLSAPQLNTSARSIFEMFGIPQQPQFDVTAATGTKPKNYTPASINVSGAPVASVFAMPGANTLPDQIFNVTPASGTKPKNYRPASISMNAPTIAGPAAMQQMLAMMQATRSGATPFAPYGQG